MSLQPHLRRHRGSGRGSRDQAASPHQRSRRFADARRRRIPIALALLSSALALSGALLLAGESGRIISSVSVSPVFFNPSIGQKEQITFYVDRAGKVDLEILDRDGFRLRTLKASQVKEGAVKLSWDGRDDAGDVVPDEAYTVRITFSGKGGRDVYDPAHGFQPIIEEPKRRSYSRREGILSYELARPSRVHLQVGESPGPILKTIVDRKPRSAGSVIEQWDGYDESGTLYLPDLPKFAIAILAASLPDNSIMAVGNRNRTFLDYAVAHRPRSATSPRDLQASHAASQHHGGLNAFEDQSPVLNLRPSGTFAPSLRAWVCEGPVTVSVSLDPRQAPYFLAQPTEINVFVDDGLVSHIEHPSEAPKILLEADKLPVGEHRLAINWYSEYGPAGVGSLRLVSRGSSSTAGKENR